MERVVNERPFFEGPQINQQRTWAANGTTGASDGIFQDPSQAWYPRRQTGWSRTRIPRGCSGGNCPTQGFGEMPARHEFLQGNFTHQRPFQYQHCESGGHDGSRFHVCHGFLQGKCTYGAACKFQHSESDKNVGFRSYGNENLANAAIAGTSQFSRGKMNDDLGSRRFYPECGSLSPCQKFQSGRCHRGALCPYLHSENTAYVRPRYDWGAHLQEEVARIPRNPGFGTRNTDNISRTPKECDENKGNELRTRSFPREPRGKSPCRNFLKGRCFRGASCPYLHSIVFGKSRDDSSRNRDQQIAATSSEPDFGERTLNVTSRRSKQRDKFKSCRVQLPQDTHAERYLSEDKKIVHERNRTWLMKNVSQSAFSQGNMDISSRSWSSVTQRRRVSHNFGGDKIKTEVCRKFRRGRCDRGESCKYLHGFNEYVRSIPDRSNQPHFESSIALRNSGGPHQPAPLMMHKEHDHVRNDNMQLSEQKHAGSGLISQDGSFDEKTERQAVNNRVEGIILDQQGETPVLDHHKRKFSGRAVAGNGEFVGPDDDDINSWSQPFKRLRSGHKSPFIARDKYCHSSHSEVVAASVASCSQEVSKDSKLMETNGLDKVTRHGMQLGQWVGSSLDSNTEFLNQKSEAELAKSSFKKENKDSEVAAPSDDSYSHEINKDSDPTETQGYDKVTSQGVALDQCPVGNLDSNAAVFKQKNEAECAKRDDNMSQVKQDGKGLMTGSHGISIPAGKNAIIADVIVSDSTISCEQNHISPVNITVSVLDKDGDTEMNINLSPGGSEKPEALTTNSKKRKRRKRSKRLADPMKKEMTDLATQGTSSSAPSDVSYCHEINKDSGPAETQGYDKVTCQGVALDQCPGGSLGSNTACLNQENEAQCAKGDGYMSPVKQGDRGLMTGSHEIPISAGKNAIIADVIVSDSTISCEKNHIAPVDADVSVLSKDGYTEMKINLIPVGSEKTEALTTNSKKRKRKKRSKCLADPMKVEMTDPATQGTSSSAGETSSSHPYIVSVTGVSADMTSTIDLPAQQHEQKIDVLISKIQNNIEPALPVAEDPVRVGDSDCCFMQTSCSTLAATSNFKRKLLILDLNGILADIVGSFPKGYKPDTRVSQKGVFKRPFCDDFLEFCFERFDVGVWSSRARKNVNAVVNFLMGNAKRRLLFCWDRSHCTATGCKTLENKDKPLVLKELKKVWEKRVANLPWQKGYYNKSNTVLLDDSPYKALRNPPNTAVFPSPYTFMDVTDNSIGPGGDLRVYLERLAAADHVQKFIKENPFGQEPITESNSHWCFYSKIIGGYVKPKKQKGKAKCQQTPPAPAQKANCQQTPPAPAHKANCQQTPPAPAHKANCQQAPPALAQSANCQQALLASAQNANCQLALLASAQNANCQQTPPASSQNAKCQQTPPAHKANCQQTPPAPARSANCQQALLASAKNANCQETPPASAQNANCQQTPPVPAQNANYQQMPSAPAQNTNCQQAPPAPAQNRRKKKKKKKTNCQQTTPAPAQKALITTSK